MKGIQMCMRCNGLSEAEITDWYLTTIETAGWALVAVEADRTSATFAYTVGLTRFHGHPEILVSGMVPPLAAALLNDLARKVSVGNQFVPGQIVTEPGHDRLQFITVDDPTVLAQAQVIYASAEAGPVPALQVVRTDRRGRWPWENGRQRSQPLFGTPSQR
jgi:hypothetical protein